MATKLNDKYLSDFIGEHEYDGVAAEVKAAHKVLHDGSGLGNDFLGWLNLPTDYDKGSHASRSVQRKSRKILMYSL